MELLNIETDVKGNQILSAKELHEYLEIKTPFGKWMLRMVEYNFDQNVDYQRVDKIVQTPTGGDNIVLDDYAITLDMAKQLCMLQRTEKGSEARRYFIECERKLNSVKNLLTARIDTITPEIVHVKAQLFDAAIENSKITDRLKELSKIQDSLWNRLSELENT
jgi:anti-repressor protein